MNIIFELESTLVGIYFSFLLLGISIPIARLVAIISKDWRD